MRACVVRTSKSSTFLANDYGYVYNTFIVYYTDNIHSRNSIPHQQRTAQSKHAHTQGRKGDMESTTPTTPIRLMILWTDDDVVCRERVVYCSVDSQSECQLKWPKPFDNKQHSDLAVRLLLLSSNWAKGYGSKWERERHRERKREWEREICKQINVNHS